VVDRRADLVEFLRARRAALTPEDVGLARGTRRRAAGLRREEVAMLAGVSVSWYTWLEQGRPINASRDVLDALARVLRLDPVEHEHLLALAGRYGRRAAGPDRDTIPASLQHLVDALVPAPAYVLNPRWDFLGWNAAFERLYPPVATLPPGERNLVWVVFTHAAVRNLIDDWESEARRILSQFRAEIVGIADQPEVATIVTLLQRESDEFRAWWPRHDVAGFETHRRVFHHPHAGKLVFEQQQLVPAGEMDLRVVVHLGVEGDDSARRLFATP
jgi:transcriptional regulator with XRE-family HTH domain